MLEALLGHADQQLYGSIVGLALSKHVYRP
jgi:hypothetical protein